MVRMNRNIQISDEVYKEIRALREEKIKATNLRVTFNDIISMFLRERKKK